MTKITRFADSHQHAYAPFEAGFRAYRDMAALGITDVNLLAYTYIETTIDNNLVCLYYKDKCRSQRVRTFGGLYYDPELNGKIMPFKEQAELLLAMGCDGMKFLDMKPNYNLYCGCSMDDPVYDPLYDMLEEQGIPLVTHIGDPANFWYRDQVSQDIIDMDWCYEDPKFLRLHEIFDITVRRLEKNPKLRMCLAHCGYMTTVPDLFCSVLDRFPNVTFDLTPGWENYVDFGKSAELWHDIFTKYSTRIFYGTDSDTNCTMEDLVTLRSMIADTISHDMTEMSIPMNPDIMMRGLALSEEAQKNICYANFDRCYAAPIKPVDHALFREHAKLIASIAEARGDENMLANVRFMTKNM